MLRALIIDDQKPAREDMEDLLGAHADLAVIGQAGTPGRARTLLALDNYDVVFLDIDLGHGEDGFDLLPDVRPGARVVFVTGFDEHAVHAFETGALDYLLKPVHPARLAKTMGRLRGPSVDGTPAIFANESGLVPIKVGPVTRLLRMDDIRTVAACENYTEVTLAAGEHFMVRRTMQQWGDTLRGVRFARVHRGLFVNIAQILRVEHRADEELKVHFAGGGAPMEVSRRHASEFRAKQALWQQEHAAALAAARSELSEPSKLSTG